MNQTQLRYAQAQDIEHIFNLSNDPFVRAKSISGQKIKWEDHVAWFNEKLNDENCLFWIATIQDDFVGQVRYDLKATRYIVSVSIVAKYRGQGIAKELLKKTTKMLFELKKECQQIYAYIKPENLGSIKTFRNAGYVYYNEEEIDNHKYLIYVLNQK